MHWAWAVAQKPFDAAARQSFTREVAASHLVSPSRLQVARQSYILEVSHIHLCDWRRSLPGAPTETLSMGGGGGGCGSNLTALRRMFPGRSGKKLQ